MKQELQYLREELNKLCDFSCEQTNKVINTVLITWGSAVAVFGMIIANYTGKNHEGELLCFIEATIFFTSNVILYFLAKKYYSIANSSFRLAGYILVFYEKRPSKTVKIGKNFGWELANLEIKAREIDQDKDKNRNSLYKKDDFYKIFILFSLFLIFIFLVLLSLIIFLSWDSFWAIGKTFGIIYFFLLLICVFYLTFSIYLFHIIPKYTSLKDEHSMKIKHVNDYFQYALDTGHYTPDDIKERFGDFYEKCKQYKLNGN